MGDYNDHKMDASLASATDVCPICKSTAQTSPNLRFKVSSRCYHRICEACVDRKFMSGKAQCPISGCNQMLWKRDWRIQTYEDLQVEREVDIRRKVFRWLDLSNLGLVEDPKKGWETAFVDLRSYNDYLEMKEEFAMNLIFNTDVVATQKKIKDFQTANGLIQTKDDPKSQAKPPVQTGDYPDASNLVKGLKTIFIPKALSPYNAYGDLSREREYYVIPNQAEKAAYSFTYEKWKEASGYDYGAYIDETMLRAFSGLGVFLDMEQSHKPDMATSLVA